jgi:hypothetical protein
MTGAPPMHLDTHQKIALGLYLFTVLYLLARDDFEQALEQSLALLVLLSMILFYRIIAYLAGFGFPAAFARDYRSNHSEAYALLFWILYLIAWVVIFFELRLY